MPDTRIWRLRHGLSQRAAAAVLAVPTGTLQGWEHGRCQTRSPLAGPVARLMRYFDLYGGLPEPRTKVARCPPADTP